MQVLVLGEPNFPPHTHTHTHPVVHWICSPDTFTHLAVTHIGVNLFLACVPSPPPPPFIQFALCLVFFKQMT